MAEATGRPQPIWANIVFFAGWTLLTLVAVPWYVVARGVTWMEVGACILLWFATGLSITAGYHRLFSHKAYKAAAPVRLFFALFGAAAWEASIITWSAHHRFHHRHVDTEDDPYNAKQGFWYSHMGWLLERGAKYEDLSNVPDLWKDPICAWQHRHYFPIAIGLNIVVTLGLGLITGHMWGMIVIALLLRVLLLHHFTWLINSAAHVWGSQPWSRGHTARDNWMLSLLTFGEGYHNYHHTFQADYRNGPFWYNIDVTKWLIWSFSRLGFATGLRRMPVDVTLGRKFDQARKDLDARVRDLDERARAALKDSLAPVEAICEDALARLHAARTSLQNGEATRRALWAAKRTARRAIREWKTATQSQLELAGAMG